MTARLPSVPVGLMPVDLVKLPFAEVADEVKTEARELV